MYFPSLLFFLLLFSSQTLLGDHDFFEHQEYHIKLPEFLENFVKQKKIKKNKIPKVTFEPYRQHCGKCHFAYQPSLMTRRAWLGLFQSDDKHTALTLQLSKIDYQTLKKYTLDNSAEHNKSYISQEVSLSIKYLPDIHRIRDIPYFSYTHNLIKPGLNWSACDQCHKKASEGDYTQ